MRVLFVAGEVAPFSKLADTAHLLRALPEAVQEHADVEPRILMPRYGVVSERRNRLHEVIRLSGEEIAAGSASDKLSVKVASIPGIRLQVYFMDSPVFFKRKGVHQDRKSEAVFDDNPARALFFARAALSTTRRLGWNPDIVHAAGWMASFMPHVLREEYGSDELFAQARSVFTPDVIDGFEPTLSADQAADLGLPTDWAGRSLRSIALQSADGVAYVASDAAAAGEPDGPALDPNASPDALATAAAELYGNVASVSA